MGDRTATVIIEPRALMREALASLMESHSYHVGYSVASTTDIDRGAFKEVQPELVMASGTDACIPVFPSPRPLIDTLQLIVCQQLRVLMVSDSAMQDLDIELQADDEDGLEPKAPPRIASFIPALEVSASEMPGASKVLERSPLDGAARSGTPRGLSEPRGAKSDGTCPRSLEQDDRAHVHRHRGSHEVDPAVDPGCELDPSGHLGPAERLLR